MSLSCPSCAKLAEVAGLKNELARLRAGRGIPIGSGHLRDWFKQNHKRCLRAGGSMIFAPVPSCRHVWPPSRMCEVFPGSRSGFTRSFGGLLASARHMTQSSRKQSVGVFGAHRTRGVCRGLPEEGLVGRARSRGSASFGRIFGLVASRETLAHDASWRTVSRWAPPAREILPPVDRDFRAEGPNPNWLWCAAKEASPKFPETPILRSKEWDQALRRRENPNAPKAPNRRRPPAGSGTGLSLIESTSKPSTDAVLP